MTTDQYLTLDQVATQLQVHRRTVQDWLRRGELKGSRVGTGRTAAWRVAAKDLQAYMEERRND